MRQEQSLQERLKPRKELKDLINLSHKNVGYMIEKVDEDFKRQE